MARFEPMSPRRRWVVFGGLGLLVAALLTVIWYLDRPVAESGDLAWSGVDFSTYEEVELLQRFVQVDTSQDAGSELAGAEFLATELEAMGLEPVIEQLGEKGANLWAILEGESPEALVLHSHIDVTPPGDLSQWDFPPFGGEIDKLWLYGRGSFDMKSVAIAQLLALRDLASRGQPPRRSVIFLATGSEEVGSQLGTRWVLDTRPELVERAWAVLTEGGVLEPKSMEEIKYWGIEFAQKRFREGFLCAGSEEELKEAAAAIILHSRELFRPRLAPEVETFARHYADSRENALYRRALIETGRTVSDPVLFGYLPRYLQALFREEIYFFPAEEESGVWTSRFFLHLLPGTDPDEAAARLLPDWLTQGLTVTLRDPVGFEGGSPIDHQVFAGLVETVRESHPQAPVGPFFLSLASTDSRFFRAAGIPSYGFSPFVIFNTDTFRKDQPNERIGLPGYVTGVELYRRAVARLAG